MMRTLRRRYFWKNMAADVLEVVRQCQSCSRNRMSLSRHSNPLKLFPANAPLEAIAMDILGPLPKTKHGNRFLLVIADRFSKLTRTVPLRTITALTVAQMFCEHWVFVYGPPVSVLTDNGPQFASRFFQAVCAELGIKKLFTSAYHPQTNGQVERYNRTIVEALRAYVSERQDDWDDFTSAVTYAYNCRVHTSIGMPPLELILSRPPVSLSLETQPSPEELKPASAKQEFLERLKTLKARAGVNLHQAQTAYKRNFDRGVRRSNQKFAPGDPVYLRIDDPQGDGYNKLKFPAQGPYEVVADDEHTIVVRIGEEEARVSADRVVRAPKQPPETQPSEADNQTVPVPADNAAPATSEREYVVERLVDDNENADGMRQYRVRWMGYSEADDTWEPEASIPRHFVRRYLRSKSH
jgi:hypothetical protein